MSISESLNLDFLETQYTAWRKDPQSVSESWRFFLQGFALAETSTESMVCSVDETQAQSQSRVDQLIHRYRDVGHLLACLDPLTACPTSHPLLDLESVGLSAADLDKSFYTTGLGGAESATLRDIVGRLKQTYCHSIGVEYMHMQDPDERRWLQERMEKNGNQPELDRADQVRILNKLSEATLFEQFLNKKYVGVTRFSLEGGDALIPMLDTLFSRAADRGAREVVLGMAHRGRLNVLANILKKPLEEIFAEFETCYDADQLVGDGDVKYHNGYLADTQTATGQELRIFLVNNPSHLEAVNGVVEGLARARQEVIGEERAGSILPVLLHGDAAFAGQGVVAEVLNMSQLKGYRTGGTAHVVINNQIGYTTLPKDARSTRYSTDVAKMLMVPIFHVHGENPEAVVQVARLAADYRARFGKDVVIDLVCYRRYGHNEGDEPYFTQPLMYQQIKGRPPVNELYAQQLLQAQKISQAEIDALHKRFEQSLASAFDEVHGSACPFPQDRFYEIWDDYSGTYSHKPVHTAVPADAIATLVEQLNRAPDGFKLNRKLKTLLERRLKAVADGQGIDWANAETLAFATLLNEGIDVRLSGQDCARGTFSQRHSEVVDSQSGETYVPLNNLKDAGGRYMVYNSLLAEMSVLGFEYGYAMARPDALVMWEAQFGDFVNNAQTIIDLFIASGQTKWQRLNGLVMLLPHGLEGLGPEHSSARPERFLQLCAEDNMQVCNPSTPAQYFHLLRRQVLSTVRKPLVVLTPKSLLRNPAAVSGRADLTDGTFQEIIDGPDNHATARKVLFCSGKLYYELEAHRQKISTKEVALVRVEQFYPFAEQPLKAAISRYQKAKQWIWVQEEPENMGGWSFMRPRLEALVKGHLDYIGRPASPTPAAGFPAIYRQQQQAVVDQAVGVLEQTP